jgi:hypothetical protein
MSVTVKNEECGAVNAIKEAMAAANLKEPPRVILDKCELKNAGNDNYSKHSRQNARKIDILIYQLCPILIRRGPTAEICFDD